MNRSGELLGKIFVLELNRTKYANANMKIPNQMKIGPRLRIVQFLDALEISNSKRGAEISRGRIIDLKFASFLIFPFLSLISFSYDFAFLRERKRYLPRCTLDPTLRPQGSALNP